MSRQITCYGFQGKPVKDEKLAYAKTTINDETNIQMYYILCHNKTMANPYVVSITRNPNWKFVRTTKIKFDYYVKFLKTQSEKYYTLAKREI